MIGCCESGDIGTKAVALGNMFHPSDEACCHITPRRVSRTMLDAEGGAGEYSRGCRRHSRSDREEIPSVNVLLVSAQYVSLSG